MFGAAAAFGVGTALAGRYLTDRPRLTQRVNSACTLAAAVVTGALLLPSSGAAVCGLFVVYYFLSAISCCAITNLNEMRGRAIGNVDDTMALQVFAWTVGFAVGGLLAALASGGADPAARQRLALLALGGGNMIYSLLAMRARRRAWA